MIRRRGTKRLVVRSRFVGKRDGADGEDMNSTANGIVPRKTVTGRRNDEGIGSKQSVIKKGERRSIGIGGIGKRRKRTIG